MYDQREIEALKSLRKEISEIEEEIEEEDDSDDEDEDERRQRLSEYEKRFWRDEHNRKEMDQRAIEAVLLRHAGKVGAGDAQGIVEDARREFEMRTRLDAFGYTEEEVETMITSERPVDKKRETYANADDEQSGMPGSSSIMTMHGAVPVKGPKGIHYTISRDATWCNADIPDVVDDTDESDSSEDNPDPTENGMPPAIA